jgi:hypothetical protein
MGLFNWFLAKPSARSAASTQTDIHATLADATRPFMPGAKSSGQTQIPAGSSSQRLEQRRSERNARRELLFQVVRESMVRVGVLSSAFKFKVLALDQRGRTFLVMIDLSAEFAGETDKLSEIEALISQTAKTRFELVVQAVYWRFYDTVVSNAVSRQAAVSAPAPMFGMPPSSRPVPASAQPLPNVAPVAAKPAPVPVKPALDAMANSGSADPLESDEVEAFKRALASGTQPGLSIPLGGAAASATSYAATQALPVRAGDVAPMPPVSNATALAAAAAARAATLAAINNKLLLTGYEDTEMPHPDAPVLSATQYGELR